MGFGPGDLKPDFPLAKLTRTRHKTHSMIDRIPNWFTVSALIEVWFAGAAMFDWLLREVAGMDNESEDPAVGLKRKDHEA